MKTGVCRCCACDILIENPIDGRPEYIYVVVNDINVQLTTIKIGIYQVRYTCCLSIISSFFSQPTVGSRCG